MGQFIKSLNLKDPINLGAILCFVIPPLGMLLLFVLGWRTIFQILIKKEKISFSYVDIFFITLGISTIGATIEMKDAYFLFTTLMILGYWGLYLHIMRIGTRGFFQIFRWIMIFGSIYSLLIGIISSFFKFPTLLGYLTGTILFGVKEPMKEYHRLIGNAYNPNFTVYILLIGLSFILAKILTSVRKNQYQSLWWQTLIVIILSFGVVQTGSRGGFGTMIGIFLLFFFRLNIKVFILLSIIALSMHNVFLQLIPRSDILNVSTMQRETIWRNSFKIWKDHWLFGTTPLGFGIEYSKLTGQDIPHAHNMLIGVFTEYGTFSGLVFILLILITAYKMLVLFFSTNKRIYLLDYFLLSLPIIVLTGIFDEPLFSPQLGLLTIILWASWERYTRQIDFFERV